MNFRISTQAMKTQSFYVTLTSPSKALICSEEKKMISGENYVINDDLWLFLGAGSDEKNINLQDESILSNAFERIGFNGIIKYL